VSETLVRVNAPHFCAGLIITGDRCTEAAPILAWAIGKRADYLRSYFAGKRWAATIVKPAPAGPSAA
jgi:hypothetical protein